MLSHCILYIPKLFELDLQHLNQSDLKALPALTTLLSRGKHLYLNDTGSPLRTVAQLCGYDMKPDAGLPLARLRRSAELSARAGTLWCADPVGMQADRDSAVMLPPDLLQITTAEAQQLIAALNQHFAEDGLRFEMQTSQHWLLHSVTPLHIQTTELPEVIGQDVRNHLPRGDDARHWRRIGNEIEMLMHNHPVNQQREVQQQWPITGVWLWGGGAVPNKVQPNPDVLYTDDDTATTIARAAALTTQALPANLHRCDWSAHQSSVMCVLQQLDSHQLIQLEAHWFAPLLVALREGALQQVTLLTRAHQFVITRRSVRQWWRRRHALTQWCRHE